MINITLIDGRYHITGPKCRLILTKAELIRALRRGKWWTRRRRLEARLQGRTSA